MVFHARMARNLYKPAYPKLFREKNDKFFEAEAFD